MNDRARPHWLVRRTTIRVLWVLGLVVLAILVAAELTIAPHPRFGLDGSFAFFAWYGLLTCAAMMLVAKLLGGFLKRHDTYYDG